MTPQELTGYRCINIRLPSYGGFYAWEFERDGHEMRVRVDGQVAFNGVPQLIQAARDGYGLAYVHEDVVRESLRDGRLVSAVSGIPSLLSLAAPTIAGLHDACRGTQVSEARRP